MSISRSSLEPLHQRLTRRFAESRFFTISLLLHVVLAGLLGGVVLFKATQDERAFTIGGSPDGFLAEQLESPANAQPEPQEFEELVESPSPPSSFSSANTSSPASPLTAMVNNSTSWQTSLSQDGYSFGSGQRQLSQVTGTGPGNSQSSSGIGGSRMKGSLFGVPVEAEKLGVILDVSGSAYPYLIYAVDEIEKSFKGSLIVLNTGCGMTPEATSQNFEVKSAKAVASQLEKPDAERVYTMALVQGWMRKNPSDATSIKRLLRDKNVLINATGYTPAAAFGAYFSFEKLIKENVDTIYWFADFGDKIDGELANRLIGELKQRKIKVIAHNFAGKNVNKVAMKIVDATGGKAITTVPQK